MTDLTSALRAHAGSIGVDLLGIAPIDRFADLPAQHHPASIFPEVRSVLVIGKRITRGALRGIEEGTQFELYGQFGRDWLNNRVLALATFRTAEFLENAGWEAVPLPNLPPETPPMGIPVKAGLPAPNVMVDCNAAAVRAGVGEVGRCGLLLTPAFGPRQRLQLILTDAALDADPLLETPVCLGCDDLAAICPLGAIDPAHGVHDGICRTCKNGAFPNNLHPSGTTDRCAALCTRTCIVRLEAAGRLANTFRNPFRTQDPWGIIEERRSLL